MESKTIVLNLTQGNPSNLIHFNLSNVHIFSFVLFSSVLFCSVLFCSLLFCYLSFSSISHCPLHSHAFLIFLSANCELTIGSQLISGVTLKQNIILAMQHKAQVKCYVSGTAQGSSKMLSDGAVQGLIKTPSCGVAQGSSKILSW